MSEDILYTNYFLTADSSRRDSGMSTEPERHERKGAALSWSAQEGAMPLPLRRQFRSAYEKRYGEPAFRKQNIQANQSAEEQQQLQLPPPKYLSGTDNNDPKLKGRDVMNHSNRPKDYFQRDTVDTSSSGNRTREKIVCIDSRDRNNFLYPSPSNFRVYLGEKFTNVRRMRLVSTELPNTEQLIKSQPPSKKNNKIYWQNGTDEADNDEVYSITITDGNYTPATFAAELMTKTSAVERKISSSSEDKIYSDFNVIVDNITNRFIMRQNNSFNLDNPISTVAGSPVVAISQDQHDLLPGQIINLSGSTKVGGIPATALNSSQVIDVDIQKVDNLYRVSDATQKATFVVYGTTKKALSGRVITKRASHIVHGLGTQFLTEINAGQVINVGYHNYVVQTVINDFSLSVEEALQETFDEYSLITNLTSASAAFQPVPNDSYKTLINVINHRLRNINLTSAQLVADQRYESEFADLSLENYQQMQSHLTIFNSSKTYDVQVTFDSRDPTYQSFSTFTLRANIENFNVQTISSNNQVFNVINAAQTTITSVALPLGSYNSIQLLAILNQCLNNFEISFDTISLTFFIKPPLSSSSITINNSSVGINDIYYPIQSYGLDFSQASSASAILGFTPVKIFGTVVVGSQVIDPAAQVTFDSTLSSFYILSPSNTFLYTVTINRSSFSHISDLVNLIRSTLLSRNIPIAISFNTGLNKVIFSPLFSGFKFSVIFQQSSSPINGIGDALGFNTECLNSNSTIVSLTAVKNYLLSGYYSYPLASYVNAVPISSSLQIKGTAIVTNASNLVAGVYDTFDYSDASFSNLASVPGSGDTLTSNLSQTHAKLLTSVPNISTASNHLYVSPSNMTSAYNLTSLKSGAHLYKLYTVQINSAGHFTFTDALTRDIFDETKILTIFAGRTTVFDLSSLPTTAALKLALNQNGEWEGGDELLINRRYMCNGHYLQYTPADSMANSTIFVYDNFNRATISSPAISSSSNPIVYFVDFNSNSSPYLQIGQSTVAGISYSEAPIIDLEIGNRYIFDYSPLVNRAGSSTSSEILLLSSTIDGAHYFGSELASAPYLLFDPTKPNKIQINLTYSNSPFPDKIFYYLRGVKGAGGAGYLSIKYQYNSGAIAIQKPPINRYDFFLSGAIVQSVHNDISQIQNGYSVLYSPFHGLMKYPAGSQIYVINQTVSSSHAASILVDSYNVTYDNNRFVLLDATSHTSHTIRLTPGFRSPENIATELQTTINDQLSLAVSNGWSIVYDSTTSKFTFLIANSKSYQMIFKGADTNGYDLLNSAAELLGFTQSSSPTNGNSSGLLTSSSISSAIATDFAAIQSQTIKVADSDLSSLSISSSSKLSWSERILHDADNSKTALITESATLFSGTRFTTDLNENDQVLLGEDHNSVFTVTNIIDDYHFQIHTNVNFVPPQVNEDGTVTAAPAIVYYQNIYVLNGLPTDKFLQNEKINFFRSIQAKSTNDYDGRLIDKNLQITRISPIKLSFVDTDTLLENSLTDDGTVNFTSLVNHNLYYIKNNSKYHFTIAYPATSNVSSRGGNPVKIGTGVKFRLLFSNTDTPGDLLGFPNVGNIASGDTEYKTVQSNTVKKADSTFDIIRSEIGVNAQAGSLKIITETPHNFEYGDVVYIEKHKNSSNDLAINNDEGHTIIILPNALTLNERENGIQRTRGIFYIPLNLTMGGIEGFAYKKQLYKPFALAGENYLYLTCPILSSLSTTSNRVSGVFAKVLLNAPPGSILFNSFVTSDKYFDEAPLPVLEYLDLAIVDLHGEYFEFNNIDWSASFSVTYSSLTEPSSGISSRTMERNDI